MEWNISLGELRPFSAFVMLKETFGKHWLIKISVIIKSEVEKMIQQKLLGN